MNPGLRTLAVLCLPLTLALTTGCGKKSESITTPSGSASFTAEDLEESWESACIAGSDPVTGGTYHVVSMTLFSGNFNASDAWYSAAGCNGAAYVAVYGTSGTYTVGAVVSGSAQALDFTVTSSDIMPMTTQAQTNMNTDCGGTSPFDGDVDAAHIGGHFSTYTILCQSAAFPNSSNQVVNNIATLSGDVLTIGAPAFGVPGVFSGDTLPASATIPLNK